MVYSYFVYVTAASLWFYLTYRQFDAKCYFFDKGKRETMEINKRFMQEELKKFQIYNGERGRQHKWLNYLFYPIHLLILGVLRFYWHM